MGNGGLVPNPPPVCGEPGTKQFHITPLSALVGKSREYSWYSFVPNRYQHTPLSLPVRMGKNQRPSFKSGDPSHQWQHWDC